MSASTQDIASGLKVFIAHSGEDTAWCNELEQQLAVLWRQGLITILTREKIEPGKEQQAEVARYLDTAQIILLLISPAFISSKQCYDIEMSRAVERYKADEVRLIPVLLKPTAGWEHMPFGELQPLPSNGKAISTWSKIELAFFNIVSGIRSVIDELLNRQDGPRMHYRSMMEDGPPPCPAGSYLQRSKLVQQIYHQLIQPEVNGVTLTGMGGIGKSTLAALLYHYIEQQRIAGQAPFPEKMLWLTIQAGTTIVDLINILREAGGKRPLDLKYLTTRDMARELFKALNTDTLRLVILDQFDALLDPQTCQALEEHPGIGEWLDMLNERPCTGRVVLTSRFSPRGKRSSPSIYLQEYRVPDLDVAEGSALLRMWGVQAKEVELHQVVMRCQGHALALVLLKDLLKDYSAARITTFFNDPRFASERIDVLAREALNYIFTHQLNQEQRDLLQAFSVYREAVPLEAAQTILEDHTAMATRRLMAAHRVLLRQHLLQDSGLFRYQPHSLVAEFAQECVDNQQRWHDAHARAAQYYQHQYDQQQATFKYQPGKQRRRIDDIHDLIEALWHYCRAGQQQQAYELILRENIFLVLTRWGSNSALLGIYQYLLPSEIWQPAPEQAARIYNEMGEIYLILGQKEKARQYFEQSLQSYRMLDQKKIDVSEGLVNALNNVGAVHRRQGEIEEALECYQKARHIADRAEEEILARGTTLNNIGYAYYQSGRRMKKQEQARQYYELALQQYRQALPLHRAAGNRGEEARTLDNLGKVYYALGRKNEACEYYQQALDLALELGDRWVEATVLHDLGACSSQFEEKLEYYEQAYFIFHAINAHEDEITVLKNLGYLHLLQEKEQKEYDVILACFVQARDMFNELQSPELSEVPNWVLLEVELALGKQQLTVLLDEVEKRAEQIIERILQR
jgi:tetratricopeptide (TPR) repeat protein